MKLKRLVACVALSALLCVQTAPGIHATAVDMGSGTNPQMMAQVEIKDEDLESVEPPAVGESSEPVEPSAVGEGSEPVEPSAVGESSEPLEPSAMEESSEPGERWPAENELPTMEESSAPRKEPQKASVLSARATTVQITDIGQLESYFPDPIFREAVFEAVRDGQDGAEGADVEDALNRFLGVVKYNKSSSTPVEQKIKDAHGIEYLRNAELVSLKYNEIRDLSWLGKEDIPDSYPESADYTANQRYYGQIRNTDPDLAEDDKNVTWDFSGNPLQKIPAYFGGQLKILQPGGASYTYGEDVSDHLVYMRPDGAAAVSGEMNIQKLGIFANGAQTAPIGIYECSVQSRPGDTPTGMTINTFTDTTADFQGLEKSGVFHVYVGTKAEINYGTNDEWSGITRGSQSAKYYVTPSIKIYDRITAQGAKTKRVQLTKVDADTGEVLPGAKYGLYKQDDTLIGEYTSDALGVIKITGLMPGEYYFKEETAPEGYRLNSEKVPFTVEENTAGTLPAITLGGGETSVTDSDGNTVTAAANQRLFAGGKAGVGETGALFSPEITLSSAEPVLSVEVTYAKLDAGGDEVKRTFATLAEAQADVNNEKEANHIIGPVSVKAYFEPADADPLVEITTQDTAIPQTEVTVNKVWVDPEDFSGTHPDITVRLMNGSAEVASAVIKAPDVSHTFTGLPTEDSGGNAITYTVAEDAVAGYTSSVNGNTVTNTFENTEKTAVSGHKLWADYNNALNTRPDSVTVALFADGTEVQTLEVKPAEDWAFTFNDLPKYTGAGKKIAYTVNEKGTAAGYTASVAGGNITNTLDPKENEIVTVSGKKIWNDAENASGLRPEKVTVSLLQNGTELITVETGAGQNWAYSFKDLPKYDTDGKEYAYTVGETSVPGGYTSTVEGTDITNTLNRGTGDTVTVNGRKVWNDFNNALGLRPEKVTISLLQNGTELITAETGAAQGWGFSFAGFAKYDAAGKEYVYTVKETSVPKGYASKVEGTTVTNTLDASYNNISKVEGKKIWSDNNDQSQKRPEFVTVDLYRNSDKIDSKTVKAADGWAFSFASLPKYDVSGKEYVYTVKESSVPAGYSSQVKGYQITNTLETANQKETPKTGDAGTSGAWALLAMAAVGVAAGIKRKKR